MDKKALERMSRDELIAHARSAGVQRAELLTRVELLDEILRLGVADEPRRRQLRGWLGVARDLVASAVEVGLDMPEAAKLIRGDASLAEPPVAQPPVATVTLAEIYAAQGHQDRSLEMLDNVLSNEPDHAFARALRDRLLESDDREKPRTDKAPKAAAPVAPAPKPKAPAPKPKAPAPIPNAPSKNTTAEASVAARPGTVSPVDADSVVIIRVDALSTYVYWEVSPHSLAQARARWPRGRPVVKVVSRQPRPEGPARIERLVSADALQGGAFVEGFGPQSVVRAALGWDLGGEFRALAVATELAQPRDDAMPDVLWVPRSSLRRTNGAEHKHFLRALVRLRELRRAAPSASV